jgi:hypothetical protein
MISLRSTTPAPPSTGLQACLLLTADVMSVVTFVRSDNGARFASRRVTRHFGHKLTLECSMAPQSPAHARSFHCNSATKQTGTDWKRYQKKHAHKWHQLVLGSRRAHCVGVVITPRLRDVSSRASDGTMHNRVPALVQDHTIALALVASQPPAYHLNVHALHVQHHSPEDTCIRGAARGRHGYCGYLGLRWSEQHDGSNVGLIETLQTPHERTHSHHNRFLPSISHLC